jgi:hypothetical protein
LGVSGLYMKTMAFGKEVEEALQMGMKQNYLLY